MTTGATQALIDTVIGITPDALPERARTVARHCLLDWFACAIAGCREPLADILARDVASGGEATLVARPERATPLAAALINGAASHALDFDDTHALMSGHPSVPVIPATLALAERDDRDGASLLAAMVAGIELECRLGALMNPGHYNIGFHNTGTLGAFGAAAACAHLLGLDDDRWRHALGLAGTQAAGLKSGFGTMAKPLHAGRAAENGLLAALLAADGFTGNTEIIETAQGFAATHAAPAPLDVSRLERLRGRWLIEDTLFKYHASCYLTHASIEAAAQVRREHSLTPADIERVELRASSASIGVCDIAGPRTGLEGKFSLLATVAMTLLGDDTSDPAAFTDARMREPNFLAMRDRIDFTPMSDRPGTRATVVVHARAQQFEAIADTGIPASDLDAQWQKLSAKFFALASPVIGDAAARALYDAVSNINQVNQAASVRDLLALTRPLVPA